MLHTRETRVELVLPQHRDGRDTKREVCNGDVGYAERQRGGWQRAEATEGSSLMRVRDRPLGFYVCICG